MTSTAHADLTHIAEQWPVLRELLEARTPSTWPPVMGLQHVDRDDDEQAAVDQAAAVERAERTAVAPGERPAPLRVSVLDTLVELEAELLALADEIAGSIQRPAITVRSASPADEVARTIAMMGARDQADPRRWRFNMAHRTGETAARWLADRLTGPAGPHRALTDAQHHRVATTAATARRRLDRTLGDPGITRTRLRVTCACGGQLETITGGAGEPRIQCDRCGTHASMVALLDGLNAA